MVYFVSFVPWLSGTRRWFDTRGALTGRPTIRDLAAAKVKGGAKVVLTVAFADDLSPGKVAARMQALGENARAGAHAGGRNENRRNILQ